MSLTTAEQQATRRELQANFALTGLDLATVATALQTTPAHVQAVLDLEVHAIEEPWILRNYLAEVLREQHVEGVPYTRLSGSPRRFWFLNQARIVRGNLA